MVDASDAPSSLPQPLALPPFDATRRGQPVLIQSTKFDGSPHYQYRGRLVDVGPGYYRVVVDAGEAYTSYREAAGTIMAPMTQIYFTDRWYNAFHNHEPIGRRRMLTYCNVGMPAHLDGDVLRWVDLDLDLIRTEALGTIVDDEDEFAEHQVRMAYPPDVIASARAALEELQALARADLFPFDRERHLP